MAQLSYVMNYKRLVEMSILGGVAVIHLVIESHVDHYHFSHHADPSGATGIMGVHTAPEPNLVKQNRGVDK